MQHRNWLAPGLTLLLHKPSFTVDLRAAGRFVLVPDKLSAHLVSPHGCTSITSVEKY